MARTAGQALPYPERSGSVSGLVNEDREATMTTPAWIGLGSNLGDRRAILDDAVAALGNVPGVVVWAVSSYHATSPVGGPPGQGPFLNAAAHLETTLDPHQLLATLQRIEDQAGRVRTVRWGERTLDLDILIYATTFLDAKELKLPHPRLAFRRFVLGPLAEIAPTVVDTMTKRTIADLLANLERKPRLLAIDGSKGRRKSTVFRRLVEELPGFGISEADMVLSEEGWGDDPFPPVFDVLERKAKALKASHWAIETLRVPWIVTDYFLSFDILRASSKSLWEGYPEARSRFVAYRERMRQTRAASKDALPPTLVVILPGDHEIHPRPGLATIPLLWPESDKPDAIVAEVVATCRGIDEA
jgi:2-amino-4-hydroxy-6-hydroxymethyldihydropteridine diphosphokinase